MWLGCMNMQISVTTKLWSIRDFYIWPWSVRINKARKLLKHLSSNSLMIQFQQKLMFDIRSRGLSFFLDPAFIAFYQFKCWSFSYVIPIKFFNLRGIWPLGNTKLMLHWCPAGSGPDCSRQIYTHTWIALISGQHLLQDIYIRWLRSICPQRQRGAYIMQGKASIAAFDRLAFYFSTHELFDWWS